MRGFCAQWSSKLLACLVLGVLASPGRAQEPHESSTPAKHNSVDRPKYEATVLQRGEPHLELEKEYDLGEEGHLEELSKALDEGRVQELRLQKPRNILAIFWDLGLWTIVVFGLLLLILRKLAWKPWLEAVAKRESSIQGAVDEAQRARDEAQALRAQLQKEMAGAQDKVREIMDNARRDAQHATDDMVAKARSEIQTERDRLHREIGMARDQALQELWSQTAQLATLISAKAIRKEVNMDDHRHLVDEAIVELRQAATQQQNSRADV